MVMDPSGLLEAQRSPDSPPLHCVLMLHIQYGRDSVAGGKREYRRYVSGYVTRGLDPGEFKSLRASDPDASQFRARPASSGRKGKYNWLRPDR